MRLRQVALVARELDPVVRDLCAVLGVQVSFNDPGVREFGLQNAVMPVGDTFLEVVSPVEKNTAAGRYLERRGGDGGYMILIQSDDLDRDLKRLKEKKVRVVWEIDLEDIRGRHLHPKDTGGTLLSLDQPVPPESWRWAGPHWEKVARTDVARKIVAAEVQSSDPESLAKRWAGLLGRKAFRKGGEIRIPLDEGTIRFVEDVDGRGEGLGGLDVEVNGVERVLEAARTRGMTVEGSRVLVGGTRFRLV